MSNDNQFIPEVSYDGDNVSPEDFMSIIQSDLTTNSSRSVQLDDDGNMITKTSSQPATPIRQEVPARTNEPGTPIPMDRPEPVKISEQDKYQAGFDFLRETGLLEVPDDMEEFSGDTLQWLVDANREKMYQEVVEEIASMAGDQYAADVYKIVHNGGTFDDIKKLVNVHESNMNLNKYDLANVNHQRAIIKLYLSEGLDIHNPAHKRRLENIDNEVQLYMSNGQGESTAIEAKKYFATKQAQKRESVKLEIEQRRQAEQQAIIERQRKEQEWISKFKQSLSAKKWSKDKKDSVVSQFDIVKLTDGTEAQLWKYKMDKIWEDPELTQYLMDFLSKFDPYKLRFEDQPESIEGKLDIKVRNLMNKRNSKTNSAEYNRGQQTAARKIDPTQI